MVGREAPNGEQRQAGGALLIPEEVASKEPRGRLALGFLPIQGPVTSPRSPRLSASVFFGRIVTTVYLRPAHSPVTPPSNIA